MAENSRELALRRASTLPKKNRLRRWASGGSARLRHLRSECPIIARFLPESLPPGSHYVCFLSLVGIIYAAYLFKLARWGNPDVSTTKCNREGCCLDGQTAWMTSLVHEPQNRFGWGFSLMAFNKRTEDSKVFSLSTKLWCHCGASMCEWGRATTGGPSGR